ncbi:MAG: hypothetical protein ABI874_11750 [Chloroflexota bacterium]
MDRGRLIDALVERGVTYLDGGSGQPSGWRDAELISALAQADDPRLRLALIALFLARPAFGSLMPSAVAQLPMPAALALKQYYTAAACLQRYWRTRLSAVVANPMPLPDWFSRDLNLPDLDVLYGRLALRALADQMAAQHDDADFWTAFQKSFEDFIRQREMEMIVT